MCDHARVRRMRRARSFGALHEAGGPRAPLLRAYDHWLCAGEATRRRLSARPPLRLLKADGSEESVDEVELHNLKRMPDDESGCWYHIVPEALLSEEEEGTNDMVKRDVVRLCRYADGYRRSVATVASD